MKNELIKKSKIKKESLTEFENFIQEIKDIDLIEKKSIKKIKIKNFEAFNMNFETCIFNPTVFVNIRHHFTCLLTNPNFCSRSCAIESIRLCSPLVVPGVFSIADSAAINKFCIALKFACMSSTIRGIKDFAPSKYSIDAKGSKSLPKTHVSFKES